MLDNNLKISILMSSYNGAKYIIDQLGSLTRQTRQADEVIIIDDHSDDDTVGLIKDFIAEHNLSDSYRLIENSVNRGWKANFKAGLQQLTGDIVFFCDQDDIWRDEKIAESLKVFCDEPDTLVIGSSVRHFDDSGNTVYIEGSLDGLTERVRYRKNKDGFKEHPPGCSMAVRRSYIDRIMPYYQDSWAHDDFFFRFGTIDEKCILIHKELIDHRLSGTNVTSISIRKLDDRMQQAQNNMNNYASLLEYCKQIGEEKGYSDTLRTNENCVKYYCEGNKVRYSFLKDRKLSQVIPLLIKYPKIYRSPKQFVGDLVLVLRK